MTSTPATGMIDEARITWRTVARSVNRPYPVTIPMLVLVLLVPFYLVIAARARGGPVYTPDLALDHVIPVVPAFALVYGAVYAFLIVLPVFVLQQHELIRRTVWAYIAVWTIAYVCFLLYPTIAPRPDKVIGDGFATWGLRFLYGSDPPYNCFPSIHVAHSFVSALACHRVNRRLGALAIVCAALVAISTLFTKQHYIVDVIGGIVLALVAYVVFLRSHSPASVPDVDRRVAPMLALCVGGIVVAGMACYWVIYRLII